MLDPIPRSLESSSQSMPPEKVKQGSVQRRGREFSPLTEDATPFPLVVSHPTEEVEEQNRLLQQRYKTNVQTLLAIRGKTEIPLLRVESGVLVRQTTPATPTEAAEVKELIQQTYRQAWGKLIDAKHGYYVQATALQELNLLRDQLVAFYPEGIPRGGREKPLCILLDAGPAPAEEMTPVLEAKREHQRAVDAAKVSLVATKALREQPLGGMDKGMNPTEFLKKRDTGETVAIAKSKGEELLSHEIAGQLGEEDSSQFLFMGGLHEMMASHLNVLLGGQLGIPLAMETGDKTVHPYVRNIGNFHDLVEDSGRGVLASIPVETSQRFVFAQLVTRNGDCHGENILFTEGGDPIPIDFGRILNPQAPMRMCFLEFPCLDYPVNEQDRRTYEELDVEETIGKLTAILQRQYPKEFKNPTTRKAIDIRLNLLKARLTMVKMAVIAGLNQREMIALELPPLTDEIEAMYRVFQEHGYWPDMDNDPPTDLFGEDGEFFSGYLARKGFQAAWNAAFDLKTNTLNTALFQEILAKEIADVKALPPDELYTERERELYARANYDWTDMPRLILD